MTADSPVTPFSILNQSVVPYRVLTVAFLTRIQESGVRRQVRWSSIPISLRAFHFVIHTVKGFSIVDETELDAFLEFPSFLYDPENVAICSLVPLPFSKPSLGIWKLLVHIMLKPSMQDFKHDLTSMGDECNCPMANTFFGTTLLGNWDED